MEVDVEKIIENTGGDRDLVVSIAKIFIKKHSSLMEDISSSIERNDPEKLWRSAHTIKGTVGYFLVDDIIWKIKKIEQIGRKGSVDGAKDLFFELNDLMKQLVLSLENSLLS